MRSKFAMNAFFYVAGIGFMFLAWLKFSLKGYNTPTPFSAEDRDKGGEHAVSIVAAWLGFLRNYAAPSAWKAADVLELGPGNTLATGALLLAHGARSYHAIDLFPLVAEPSPDFYSGLLADFDPIRRQKIVKAIVDKDDEVITHSVEHSFKIDQAVGPKTFDLFVSCAAFEHFDSIEETIARITRLAKPNAIFCATIDFKTHSRWIRDKDPNNIYRYPNWLYDLFWFTSKPNRKRPDEYAQLLRASGWENIQFKPQEKTSADYHQATKEWLDPQFLRSTSDMDVLTGTILATFSKTIPLGGS